MLDLKFETLLKVGILLESSIEFELKGKFKLGNSTIQSGRYLAQLTNNEISTSFLSGHEIELVPTPNATFKLCNVKIGIGFHWEQNEDQEFEGGLKLQIEEGKIRAINIVPLEKYLKSVISSEMSAMNDPVLLKVHAIVSRSWLLAQLQNRNKTSNHFNSYSESYNSDGSLEITKWYDREDHVSFDVCADDHCQRYQGITKVLSNNALKAIEETNGQVLTYGNEICDARFSKCCGGITEGFENVWQPVKVPYLASILDSSSPEKYFKPINFEDFISSSPKAFCNTTDPKILSQVLIDFDQKTTNFYRWKIELTQNEISSLLRKKSGLNVGKVIDLIPLERGSSGRITRLKIIGTKQSIVVGKELEIRKWLSESHLYSSAFIVEKEFDLDSKNPSKFILKGAGWGHGAGMCQIGAAVMSQRKYSSTEILEHYFLDAKLNKVY